MASAPIIDVGTPPVDVLRQGEDGHAVVYFHDLEKLDNTRGSFVESCPFYCIGNHMWKIRFYLGGSMDASSNSTAPFGRNEYCSSVGIEYCSDSEVSARVELSILQSWKYTILI